MRVYLFCSNLVRVVSTSILACQHWVVWQVWVVFNFTAWVQHLLYSQLLGQNVSCCFLLPAVVEAAMISISCNAHMLVLCCFWVNSLPTHIFSSLRYSTLVRTAFCVLFLLHVVFFYYWIYILLFLKTYK